MSKEIKHVLMDASDEIKILRNWKREAVIRLEAIDDMLSLFNNQPSRTRGESCMKEDVCWKIDKLVKEMTETEQKEGK